MSFDKCTYCATYHQIKIKNISVIPERPFVPLCSHSLSWFIHWSVLYSSRLVLPVLEFRISGVIHKLVLWLILMSKYLRLFCYCVYQKFDVFYCWVVFHSMNIWMYYNLFMYSAIENIWITLFLSTTSRVVMNIHLQVFLVDVICLFLEFA